MLLDTMCRVACLAKATCCISKSRPPISQEIQDGLQTMSLELTFISDPTHYQTIFEDHQGTSRHSSSTRVQDW